MCSTRTSLALDSFRRVMSAVLIACLLMFSATQGHTAGHQTLVVGQNTVASLQESSSDAPQPNTAPCDCLHTLCGKLVARSPEPVETATDPVPVSKPIAKPDRVLSSGVFDQLTKPPRV